jgi:hypothetical protein
MNPWMAQVGTNTKGISSEYDVVADLMRRGWNVFKNASPYGPVDLLISEPTAGSRRGFRRTDIYRVQVKSSFKAATDYEKEYNDVIVTVKDDFIYYRVVKELQSFFPGAEDFTRPSETFPKG